MSRRPASTWQLDDEVVEALTREAGFGRRRRYREGSALYVQGEASTRFYFIVSGLVMVSIDRADGTEVVLEFMGPRSVCGEGAAFDGLPRFSGAIAVQDTEAVEFDAASLTPIFREHPDFASTLLRITSLKQRVLAARLEHLASREPQGRVMELFGRLAEMFSVPHAEGRLVTTRLTHDQIAAMTGMSRVTITRTMQRLRDRGAIDLVDGRVLMRAETASEPSG